MKEVGHKITETCSQEEASLVNQETGNIETRWKELNVNAKKRKRSIEENYDLSSQFFDGAEKLKDSFAEVKEKIEADQSIGKDKSMVRSQIKKHKVNFTFALLMISLMMNKIYWFKDKEIICKFVTNISVHVVAKLDVALGIRTLVSIDEFCSHVEHYFPCVLNFYLC